MLIAGEKSRSELDSVFVISCFRTHVDDDPFAVVVVVLDRVEVVLARVLRVLVDALILVRAQLRQRPGKREKRKCGVEIGRFDIMGRFRP